MKFFFFTLHKVKMSEQQEENKKVLLKQLKQEIVGEFFEQFYDILTNMQQKIDDMTDEKFRDQRLSEEQLESMKKELFQPFYDNRRVGCDTFEDLVYDENGVYTNCFYDSDE